MNLSFLSVCSGIETASIALEPLGWRPLAFSEIEPFPSAVLAHRWPDVPNLGDFTTIKREDLSETPDVLIGGTPCQAFSVGGLRKGLEDERGNLTLEYVKLANRIDDGELIILWENVPGALSMHDNAFGCFLGALVGSDTALDEPAGGKWPCAGMVDGPQRRAAWRILDAQYFGTPQRRERLYVIASARSDFDPASALFEPEGLRGVSQEGGIQVEDAPSSLGRCFAIGGIADYRESTVAATSRASGGDLGGGSETLVVFFDSVGYGDARERDISGPITSKAHALQGNMGMIVNGLRVRKLTPRECERLQGIPDDHTIIPYRGKPADRCPEGPRYKALGNAFNAAVINWIGRRIEGDLIGWEEL